MFYTANSPNPNTDTVQDIHKVMERKRQVPCEKEKRKERIKGRKQAKKQMSK